MRFNFGPLLQLVLFPVKTTRKLVEKALFQRSECLIEALLSQTDDFQIVQDWIDRIRTVHNNDVREKRDRFCAHIAEKDSNFPRRGIFEHPANSPLRRSFVSHPVVSFRFAPPLKACGGSKNRSLATSQVFRFPIGTLRANDDL